MKKSILLTALFLGFSWVAKSQNTQIIMDFDTVHQATFVWWTGELNPIAANPIDTTINESPTVAEYLRSDTTSFDVIVIQTNGFMRVEEFATANPAAPRFRMKVLTDAPVNTRVVLQIGDMNDDTYETGIHSEYEARTTVQDEWEVLTFNFIHQVPTFASTNTSVNKIIILFNPNNAVSHTYHFDDLEGPEFHVVSVPSLAESRINLAQNFPNPARNVTQINYAVKTAGNVELMLYDMMGREVKSMVTGYHSVGEYNYHLNTNDLTDGIYFYTLTIGDARLTKKLTITK